MKTKTLLLACLTIFLFSCSSEEILEELLPYDNIAIIGKWKY